MWRQTRSSRWFRMQSDVMRTNCSAVCRCVLVVTACVAACGLAGARGACGRRRRSTRSSSVPTECAKCHQGAGFGYQQCLMLLTAHSKAYAALALPESKEIARLSGIPQEPQQAAMCLGCHATGCGGRGMGEGRHLPLRRRRAVREMPRCRQRVHGRKRS